ncbi:MAG TPA: IS200/IS605 family transposase [Candidatus Saccharimonadales bacterium]|nr:IS200/IS605 family transposase [Candidatus Saccharimonadales bacterium]
MEFRRQSHAVFYTRYHLVFSTRFRRKILKSGLGEYMKVLMRAIHRRSPEIQIFEVNTDLDHIHLLVSIPPRMAVSEAVRILKSNTARMMVKKFPFLKEVYFDREAGIWSTGYFVSTVGVNEQQIRRYIEHQGKEDSGQAELDLG